MWSRRPRTRWIWRSAQLARQTEAAWRRWLSAGARLWLGPLVVEPSTLAERLVQVSTSAPGARLLDPILRANLEAHGWELVDEAADQALVRLAARSPAAHARLALRLARLHQQAGAIRRPLQLLESVAAERPPDEAPGALRPLRRQARWLCEGLPLGPRQPRAMAAAPGRVLYYANQTRPHHTSGYAIRTHWLARTLRARGWDLSVQARLGYPNDRWDFFGVRRAEAEARIDGVVYRFSPEGRQRRDLETYKEAAVANLYAACRRLRPALLHAASNHTVGLAAAEVARQLGIPFVYEVRGLWHMTGGATRPAYLDSEHYRMIEGLEAQAAAAADHVFAITGAVRQILIDHGVDGDRISLLPNAVDADAFLHPQPDAALVRRWGLRPDRPTVGYVGTFKEYEGLSQLLQAAARIRRRRGDSFDLLLVGDGEAEPELRALSRRLGLEDLVRFTGRVDPETAARSYGLCDVVAFPRRGLRVCRVISPLKPFEAMAAQSAVLVSDVEALTEIVRHEQTGLVHRADDVTSLAEQLERYLADPDLRARMARQGREWVVEQRTWNRVCLEVDRVYRELLDDGAGRSGGPG